jgi:cellulose synthase/poly-beta-1,6-N-acetylglucosamine synthase-like glycosyltransferase
VIPGCAGAFKTSLFQDKIITIDHDTLTEDLDFTYKLHEQDLLICYNQNAICYTQDPHTLRSYINQMRRWYGGGWQNLEKHIAIVVKNPNAALQLSVNYLEGLAFSTLFFVLPFINFAIFLRVLWLYLIFCMLSGLYASWRRKRIDLFVYSPFGVLLGAINAWLFLERFIVEILLRKKNMIWFHPERRAFVTKNI